MPLYKFGPNDVYHNTIKTHPSCSFFIYYEDIIYNNRTSISGAFIEGHSGISRTGYVSLYELNIDRNDISVPPEDELPLSTIGNEGVGDYRVYDKGLIYPYTIKKDLSSEAIKTISAHQFTNIYEPGAVMSGAYSMSASVSRHFFPALHAGAITTHNSAEVLGSLYSTDVLPVEEHARILKARASSSYIEALQTRLDYDSILSTHYDYNNVEPAGDNWDKSRQAVNLISIPSIMYGSGIKKGSVSLKYFITGTLVGELRDIKNNGELIQVEPSALGTSTGSGSVAGVVMYNEGFVLLTGSWTLANSGAAAVTFNDRDVFGANSTSNAPSWLRFAHGITNGLGKGTNPSSSYSMEFLGTNNVSTVSMAAHAKKGELNWSNNPSYISSSATSSYVTPQAGRFRYYEKELEIKNIVSASYSETTGSFEKITYISKVGVYDKDKNLIAIASIANPVKKTEERDLTFKLKLDI